MRGQLLRDEHQQQRQLGTTTRLRDIRDQCDLFSVHSSRSIDGGVPGGSPVKVRFDFWKPKNFYFYTHVLPIGNGHMEMTKAVN